MTDERISRLLDAVEGLKVVGTGWIARCPTHEDHDPSLVITPGEKGWLVYCHAGCQLADILAAAGMTVPMLFYDYDDNRPTHTATAGLRKLRQRLSPHRLDRLERFDEIAWAVWPQRAVQFSQACVEYQEVVKLPFLEAMKQWTLIRDGFLFSWLGFDRWQRARLSAYGLLMEQWRKEQR